MVTYSTFDTNEWSFTFILHIQLFIHVVAKRPRGEN